MEITYLDPAFGCEISALFFGGFLGLKFQTLRGFRWSWDLKIGGSRTWKLHHQKKYPKERLGTWMSQEVRILLNGVYWGYNPLTNLLLSSWDIQVWGVSGYDRTPGSAKFKKMCLCRSWLEHLQPRKHHGTQPRTLGKWTFFFWSGRFLGSCC